MVGPFFVRVLTSSVQGVGGNVGRLTALSTLGSFGGTVLIGYVLIPLLPNSWIMYLTAGVLFCVVAVYFLVWRRRSHHLPAVFVGLLIGLLVGYGGIRIEGRPEFTSAVQRFRGNSNFGQLQVIDMEGGSRRFYMNDYLVQNVYDAKEGRSAALFSYMLHDLAYAYTPSIKTALCIGLGIGIVPSQLADEGVSVDVAEINPAVVPVAKEFFGCRPEKFRLTIGDGRQFVNRCTNRYDVVVLDAFLGDSSPSHLMSREAFESIRRLLNTNGTLVINSFADFKADRDFFGASLEKTLKSVFRNVRIHTAPRGNVFYVASDRGELSVLRPPDFSAVYPSVREEARICFNSITEADPSHGIVLSDDFNPVEARDAANRERIRRQLALGMREL
jgi:spermidine synthase